MTKGRLDAKRTVGVAFLAMLACFHLSSMANAPCDDQAKVLFEDKFDQEEIELTEEE